MSSKLNAYQKIQKFMKICIFEKKVFGGEFVSGTSGFWISL
jgi:hypothetical protein